ncbi:hypothetical protein TWF281_008659 [Arthrobotrys megalospora]
MSLLDQDIPSGGHTCSRCSVLFGQGASRARHVHNRDRSPYNDGPRRVTVFINPSKRPYVAPFRRVQTLDRLLQYISTLPHPQIRFVTTANPAKPAFRACEEMLFAGQWQLVDSSGCIIRPEDYEELIHDGMDITIDTLPYEQQQQEEPAPLLQPMGVSGGKSIQGSGSQIGRNEVAGDLLDIQINVTEPMAAQHTHHQPGATVAQYTSGGRFTSSFEEGVDLGELEGEEKPEPQVQLRNTFIMPPKPAPWTSKRVASAMSAAAAEFKPGTGLQSPSLPIEDPVSHLRQATGKRSMAIPIVKPPSPALSMVAAPKPDLPITSHEDDDVDDDWENRVAAASEPETDPAIEELASSETEEMENKADEVDNLIDDELPRSFVSAEEQAIQISPPTEDPEDLETASASDTMVGSGPKCEDPQPHGRISPVHSRCVSPRQAEKVPQDADTSSQNSSVEPDSKFGDENRLFDYFIPDSRNEGVELESVITGVDRSETPIVETESLGRGGGVVEEVEEKEEEPVPTEKQSSIEMLAALMSGAEFKPPSYTNPQEVDGNFKWDEEVQHSPPEEPVPSDNLDPTASSWDAPSWGGDFQATSGGSGWGDWSTAHDSKIDESQWDNRGHVRRDSDGDAEWGPPKPKKPEYVEAPKPAKPAWGKGGPIQWPSRPTAGDPGPAIAPAAPTRPPAAPKKAITITNPTGQPITFPPRPGSSSKSPKQKRGVPCKYIFFVPPPNCSIPDATNSNKISLVQSTTIRKLTQLYAKHYKESRLLSCANNLLHNPVLELTVSRSEGGPGTTYDVEADTKLVDCDFGDEFWVSIVYPGSRGGEKT